MTSLVVGPLLVLINQTTLVRRAFHAVAPSPSQIFRVGLTFLVPFLVSLYSSAMADSKGWVHRDR